MADQGPDIDAAFFRERIQVIADRFPVHIEPGLHHAERDLLGIRKELEIPLSVTRPHRSDTLAALGDGIPGRRRAHRLSDPRLLQ
jgi:hypothetical protein